MPMAMVESPAAAPTPVAITTSHSSLARISLRRNASASIARRRRGERGM
jgi:hypothetical protein